MWDLASESDRKEAVAILRENKLRELVRKAFTDCDPLVMSAADYLIEKHGLRGQAAEIQDALLKTL